MSFTYYERETIAQSFLPVSIEGRAIYEAKDMKKAAEEMAKGLF